MSFDPETDEWSKRGDTGHCDDSSHDHLGEPCDYWEDGEHCFAPDPPASYPSPPNPWEGKTKACACGKTVKAKR